VYRHLEQSFWRVRIVATIYGRRSIAITVCFKELKRSNLRGAVHKIRPQSEGNGKFVQCGQRGRGFFRCGRPHISVPKSSVFRNLWCVRPARTREVSQFSRFCADTLYGRPLTNQPWIFRVFCVIIFHFNLYRSRSRERHRSYRSRWTFIDHQMVAFSNSYWILGEFSTLYFNLLLWFGRLASLCWYSCEHSSDIHLIGYFVISPYYCIWRASSGSGFWCHFGRKYALWIFWII